MTAWFNDTGIGGRRSAFPDTPVSALMAACGDDPVARARGFATLVEAYWKPVYKCVRVRFGKGNEEAKDLTQGFFTYALERDMFESFDPERARFRVFARRCLRNFVFNEETASRRKKRGGDVVRLDLDYSEAEQEIKLGVDPSESFEEAFDRELSRSLRSLAVDALQQDLTRMGKTLYFELFLEYDLADEADRPTYADLAKKYGLKTTDVTNYLSYVRRKLRQIILGKLRELTASEEEFRDEARSMLGVSLDSVA